jgi:hypothetical protein
MNITKFGVMVFIYNTDELGNNKVKLEYTIFDYLNVSSPTQSNLFTASYAAQNSSFLFGISNLKFYGATDIGW